MAYDGLKSSSCDPLNKSLLSLVKACVFWMLETQWTVKYNTLIDL